MKKNSFLIRALCITAIFSLTAAFGINLALAGFSAIPAPPIKHQFTFQLKPGDEKTGSILIENFDSSSVTLNLYGADGTQSDQGTFALTSASQEQKHLGKWISLANKTITLQAKEKKEILFKINVPADATPGNYSGGIAVETGKSASDTGTVNSVNITSRFVVKVFVKIPGLKNHIFEWTDFSFQPQSQSGDPVYIIPAGFSLQYKNLGNTIIKIDQKITVSGFPAPTISNKDTYAKAKTDDQKNIIFDLSGATLLQGNQTKIPVKWPGSPEFGYYKATAAITFSEYDIITGKNLNSQTLTKEINITIPIKWNSTPGIIIILILLAIIGIAAFLITRKILLDKFIKNCKTYTVSQGETIEAIANNYKTGWKKLAKINKIKAPFILKTSQKILVPKK